MESPPRTVLAEPKLAARNEEPVRIQQINMPHKQNVSAAHHLVTPKVRGPILVH